MIMLFVALAVVTSCCLAVTYTGYRQRRRE